MRGIRAIAAAATVAVVAAATVATAGPAGPDGSRPADEADGRDEVGFDTVVLDAGHGGEDEGARGRSGTLEKEVVLDVVERLAARLRTLGYRVVLTREDDRFVSLDDRVSRANASGGDLFVSVHANAAPQGWVRGVETFFLSLEASDDAARDLARVENEAFRGAGLAAEPTDAVLGILGDLAMSEHMMESNEFARIAQETLAERSAARSRGVKQAPFAVLMGVRMPATLVEIGFLSNEQDERALARDDRRERIAEALARSIVRFAERYDARRGVDDTPPAVASGGER